MNPLSHLDSRGRARMVPVHEKPVTHRFAVASADVVMKPATLRAVQTGRTKKGNVLEVARLAGIAAAKQTHALIPLCHPVAITHIAVDLRVRPPRTILIQARVDAVDRTGAEMEALTAASVCGLTIYDMCKAVDREIEIRNIRLVEKAGGKSGHFIRKTVWRHTK
ncbi:MAG: cyclic pyranopterin monophosphate synthase MoaC [Planctomycetes bacterium]|nr:cyclic pyranopterin monophosphate synthase MoaC [Planctomycetota bacterium]